MTYCEDYPCCGHTNLDPCAGTGYDPYSDPHLLCDHNTGFCEAEEDEPECDGDPDDCPEGGCDHCQEDDGYYLSGSGELANDDSYIDYLNN